MQKCLKCLNSLFPTIVCEDYLHYHCKECEIFIEFFDNHSYIHKCIKITDGDYVILYYFNSKNIRIIYDAFEIIFNHIFDEEYDQFMIYDFFKKYIDNICFM